MALHWAFLCIGLCLGLLAGMDIERYLTRWRDRKIAALEQETSCCGHRSDCAVHNAPAYEPGPCDCGHEAALQEVEK